MIVSTIEHLTINFIPVSNSEKPVVGKKCYVRTKFIIIHPLTEYLSKYINQCGAASCYTCSIFINDQSFKSNLTGKEYKIISYDRLSCGFTNVIYGIQRSRMNGHRKLKKEDKAYSTDTSINQIILWMK